MTKFWHWYCGLPAVLFLLAGPAQAQFDYTPNLIQNPGFESSFTNGKWVGLPTGFGKGILGQSIYFVNSGHYSLRLVPNDNNETHWLPDDFGIGQNLDPVAYRGQPLYFGGWLHADGGATAVIRMLAVRASDGTIAFRELRQSATTDSKPVYLWDVLDVPNVDLSFLIVSCTVQGTSGDAWFDDVGVTPNAPASALEIGAYDPGPPLSAQVLVDATTTVRNIPQTLYGMNLDWVYNGHGMWDQYQGQLSDWLLQLGQNLGATLWRFPGGLYADYYHWMNGVGPQASRPLIPTTPADPGTSANGFGTDEALTFANLTGAQMMFTTNPNLGTPQEAADWVSYVNNGSRYVSYWEVGNELYLPLYSASGGTNNYTPDQYVSLFQTYATAMKAADPTIQIGADIEFDYPFDGCGNIGTDGCWTDVVIKNTANMADFLMLRNAFSPAPLVPFVDDSGSDVRTVYSAMLAAPLVVKGLLDTVSSKIDTLAGANASRINIAMVEWGPLFDITLQSQLADHIKTMGSALYTADALKVMIENPRVQIAEGFKFIDEGVGGWIGPRSGIYTPKAAYYAFQMFTQHFGPVLVPTTVYSPTYNSRSIGWVPAVQNVPYLDVVSSMSQDSTTMYVMVINKHFDRAIQGTIQLNGFNAGGQGTAWVLASTALDANTGTDEPANISPQTVEVPDGRFYQGGPGEVTVTSSTFAATGSSVSYLFPPHSVTALVLTGAPAAPGNNCANNSPGQSTCPGGN